MRQRYPNFRQAQREGGPYRRGRKPRGRSNKEFGILLVVSCSVVAYVV